jgi:hypothetical protein
MLTSHPLRRPDTGPQIPARTWTLGPLAVAARMRDHGISDAEARGHFASWAEEDRYFPLDAEIAALREAGFDEVECLWRRGLCAVTCGLRAS